MTFGQQIKFLKNKTRLPCPFTFFILQNTLNIKYLRIKLTK